MSVLFLVCGYAVLSLAALLGFAAAAGRTSEDWSEHLSRNPQALAAARQHLLNAAESQPPATHTSNAPLTQ